MAQLAMLETGQLPITPGAVQIGNAAFIVKKRVFKEAQENA
jgi:hypothetical protein